MPSRKVRNPAFPHMISICGRYGDQEGLAEATCSGVCLPGYYCPMGSIHNRQVSKLVYIKVKKI